MSLRRTLAVLAAAFVFGAALHAQTHLEAGRPFVTAYRWTDYDAPPENWVVTQDRRGAMYFGNLGGVLEYDGASWRLISLPNHTNIRALACDDDGRIWVRGHDDFGYLAPDVQGRMQFVSLLDHVPEARRGFGAAWQAISTPEGVYFLTGFNVFRWDGRTMRVWPIEKEGHVVAVVDGTFYLMQLERGLLRLEGDALRLVPGGERFAEAPIYVMLPYGDGRILLGTREEGLFLYDPTPAQGDARFTPFPTDTEALLAEGRIYLPGVVLPGGRFALGTVAVGLVVIDQEERLLHHLDTDAGLPNNSVSYVHVDQAGDIWLAHGRGLSRVEIDAPLSHYDAKPGLNTQVLTVARHDGRLYAATMDGLFRLEPQSVSSEKL